MRTKVGKFARFYDTESLFANVGAQISVYYDLELVEITQWYGIKKVVRYVSGSDIVWSRSCKYVMFCFQTSR